MALRVVVQRFTRSTVRRSLPKVVVARCGMATSATSPISPFTSRPHGFEAGLAPARWLEKYRQHDPADLWQVGVFPVQDAMRPMERAMELEEDDGDMIHEPESILSSQDVWDTQGMLSPLAETTSLPHGVGLSVNEMLRALEQAVNAEDEEVEALQVEEEFDEEEGQVDAEVHADSVVRKRRKKMNKHKYRKRKKALRMRTKKT